MNYSSFLSKTKIYILGLIVFLILAPILMIGVKKLTIYFGAQSQGRPSTPVSTEKVKVDSWSRSLISVGSISADQGINVTVSLPGIVDKIYFNSGDQVSKGATLIRQDTSVLTAELEGLKADQQLHSIQFERMAKLFKVKKISKSELDRSEALLKQARAKVKAKSNEIQLKTIVAPFDGLLGIRQINLGTYLQPGDPIVQLSNISPIHIDFTLPEKYINEIKIGLVTEIKVAAYPDHKFTGLVTAIDPLIKLDTRNVSLRATLDNKEKLLRPGMYCEVNAIIESKRQVLTLPETAIFFTPYGNSVFVLDKDQNGAKLKKKIVSTGDRLKGRIEIVGGLYEGEEVVTVGQNKLREGMSVSSINILNSE